MKKWILGFVVGMLILVQTGSAMIHGIQIKEHSVVAPGDELDQMQEIYEEDIMLPIGAPKIVPGVQINFSAAQSFIPEKEYLSKVEVLIARNTSTYLPVYATITETLTGPVLTSAQVAAFDVPELVFEWVEFDFTDIEVSVGQTYYLSVYTWNISDNYYAWAANTDHLAYPNGCAWLSLDDGKSWGNSSASMDMDQYSELGLVECYQQVDVSPFVDIQVTSRLEQNGTWDMCFCTYGYNLPPAVEIITPKRAVYLANEWLFPFSEIVIIGVIRLELQAVDHSGVDVVDFYIDEQFAGNDTEAPYEYLWDERVFFKHFVRIEVFDSLGMKQVTELELWKFF